MRAMLLVLSILATGSFLVVAAPAADAFGTCTIASGWVNGGPHCPAVACIGTSWSYGDYYYTCQTEIIPIPPCACRPLE
jgi:hypothetical protein